MLETAKVTKVPYLLDVTNYYFSVFFGEAGMISTIKLYNSTIATGYSSCKIGFLLSKWISAENMVNYDLDALCV